MSLFKKKIKVVTHGGDFHADDVLACAVLSLWADKNGYKLEIIRSRDEEIIKKADIVVDVGRISDSDNKRFDHHQKGGAGIRENGVPYASFGLVWRKYGLDICGDQEIADRVEKSLIMPIDARDSGVNICMANELGVNEHHTTEMICNFNLTQKEDGKLAYKQFEKALYFAKEIIKREIAWALALNDGDKETTKAIEEQNEPEILILERSIEWHEAVSKNKKIKFVVYLHRNGKHWCVQCGRDDLEDYNSDRANFPKAWRGLREVELVNVSGIKDASFCTNGGWYGTAKSKIGAIEMANKALQNSQN